MSWLLRRAAEHVKNELKLICLSSLRRTASSQLNITIMNKINLFTESAIQRQTLSCVASEAPRPITTAKGKTNYKARFTFQHDGQELSLVAFRNNKQEPKFAAGDTVEIVAERKETEQRTWFIIP